MALRATVPFPRVVFGPVERSAFLRLACTRRTDTGCLRGESSGEDWVDESLDDSGRDMQQFSQMSERGKKCV